MEELPFLIPARVLEDAKLEKGEQVADLGAGSGFFTIAAARVVGSSGSVWAVDLKPELLSRIKSHATSEHLKNVEVVRGDLEAGRGSNLPAGKFDFVIATNVLFWLEDKLAFAKEAHRLLKKGGRALVVDWKDSYGGMGPHPDHIITIGAARDIFEKAGFAFSHDVPAGSYHWGFIAIRKS